VKKIQWGLFIPGLVTAMMVPVWLLIVVPELNRLPEKYYSSLEFQGTQRLLRNHYQLWIPLTLGILALAFLVATWLTVVKHQKGG